MAGRGGLDEFTGEDASDPESYTTARSEISVATDEHLTDKHVMIRVNDILAITQTLLQDIRSPPSFHATQNGATSWPFTQTTIDVDSLFEGTDY